MWKHTHINEATGCWEWTGSVVGRGYGATKVPNPKGGWRNEYVHRLSYMLHNGPIPPGKQVLHRCDNMPCWNPEHLFSGTNTENRQDSVAKRRHAYGERAGASRLTEAQVVAVREARSRGATMKQIAADFGIPRKTVEKIVYRVSWKHLP